jgi:hypothetical protein
MFSSFIANAQPIDKVNSQKDETEVAIKIPNFFYNLSTGINNTHGIIGIGANVLVSKNLLLGAGVGTGWGSKLNFNGIYFFKDNMLGNAFGGSLAYSTGREIKQNSTFKLSVNNQFVYGNMGPTSSLNLFYGRYWKFLKRSRFFIHSGFVGKFYQPDIDMFYVNSSLPVSKNDSRTLKYTSPGGLMISGGFLFFLN